MYNAAVGRTENTSQSGGSQGGERSRLPFFSGSPTHPQPGCKVSTKPAVNDLIRGSSQMREPKRKCTTILSHPKSDKQRRIAAMSGFRTWIRSAILLSFLILSAGSDFEEWYVAISMHSKFVRHYISQKRRLQLFAKTDTAGVELSSSNNTQDVSSVVAFSNGKARVLTVEARACMKYMDAELHPSIGSATVQLQRALQERGMADDGITAVAALLHFEKFVGGTGRWAEMLMTMGRAARLPATWDRRHTELLSIANLDMSWFQTQLQVTELQVQLIFEHVVKPNPSQYIMEADSAPNGSQVLEQLRWAVAITRALALPPMFQGDSVAICPVFHAAPHSADAPEVQHTTTELANVLGQTRTIVDKYFIPLPDTTGSPLRIRRVDETGMCAHELFFLFGTREAKAMPCIPLKISVPALSAKPSALAVLRRTAMAAGELVTANSSMSHSAMFNLSPGVPLPTELLRLLRLSNLQYTDAE